MKKNALAVLLSSALLVPVAAFAEGERGDPGMVFIAGADAGFYVGGGYTQLTYDENGLSDDLSLGAVFARGGYQINPNFALEARIGMGVADDEIEDVEVEVEEMYGAYIKVGAPTLNRLYPYVLVGYTNTKLKASFAGESESADGDGASYGLGADVYITHNIAANIEYLEIYNKSDAKVGGWTLGMNYKF